MNCRTMTALQPLSESMANRPMTSGAFELADRGRIVRGIGGILDLVPPSNRCVGIAFLGGWHELEERWRPGSPMCLSNAIPSHARSLLRGILLLRPAARRRSAFPGAPQNKFENSGKERRSNFFRPCAQ